MIYIYSLRQMPRNSHQEVYSGSPHPFSLTYIKHVDVTKDASHQQYFRLVIESSSRTLSNWYIRQMVRNISVWSIDTLAKTLHFCLRYKSIKGCFNSENVHFWSLHYQSWILLGTYKIHNHFAKFIPFFKPNLVESIRVFSSTHACVSSKQAYICCQAFNQGNMVVYIYRAGIIYNFFYNIDIWQLIYHWSIWWHSLE